MKQKTISREELFEKAPVWSAIFSLTIPMIISSLVAMIYNLSDTFFVGILNDSVQNAAITLTAPAMTLFYGITNLFGIGASSLMSRSMGAKDIITLSALFCVLILFNAAGQPIIRIFMNNDEIVRTGAWFLSGFGISLPFMCVDFMVVGVSQAFGMGKPALIFSFLRKLFLEIPFIMLFNAAAGVMGIAYAQCVTEIIMAIVAFCVQKAILKNKMT